MTDELDIKNPLVRLRLYLAVATNINYLAIAASPVTWVILAWVALWSFGLPALAEML